MKNFWKSLTTMLAVIILSVGATYGTYSFLESRKESKSLNDANYGNKFGQASLHLASLTADGYPDFTRVAESSVHGVVHIKSVMKPTASVSPNQRIPSPLERFFGFENGEQMPRNVEPSVGYGSGVIISKDGYVVTNNHVIEGANEIEVTLNDNSKFAAKLVGTDPATDIALLKIEGSNFSYIPFGDSDNLKVGEWVLAVGNPLNLTSTVTAGIVSAKARGGGAPRTPGEMKIQSYIQTDAAINRGNSGGALVNTNGELVGINTAIYSRTGEFSGYGFAVPISIAGKVVADLKEHGAVQRAVLGVMILGVADMKEAYPDKVGEITVNEGVYVNGFSSVSSAKQAGVEEGDVIVAVNGAKVRSVSELQDQVNRHRPGDKITLDIKRGKSDKKIEVTLKNDAGNTSIVKKEDGLAVVGAAFKELTDEKKKSLGVSVGVEIAGVERDGKFAQRGMSKGFVITKINGVVVNSVSQVESIIKSVASSSDGENVLYISGFNSVGRREYYAIPLTD